MADATHQSNNTSLADFIWKNADVLWGDFTHIDMGNIILPFTLLRRLECVLEPTRQIVRTTYESMKDSGIDVDMVLRQTTKFPFYNTSSYSLETLGGTRTRQNLEDFIANFSDNARIIFEQFDFSNTVARLDKAGLLYKICQNFAAIDLHPNAVPDRVMSNVYEHLIRRFGSEVSEAAEDFMTPRDVVHLATTLLLDPDDALFESNPGLIRTLYDPTCGTGGFLSDAMEHVNNLRNRFKIAPVLVPHGQEIAPKTHAVCLTSMLLHTLESDPGRDLSKNIKLGSTLSNDGFKNEKFHYCLANPPFGKPWTNDEQAVMDEHADMKFEGRFGPKLPRVSDGSMLFLLHVINKLEHLHNGGGRAAIVLSGSPLFNGNAGQGESEIRRYLLEKDLVEAIVALPTEIFFRTGIATYIWLLSNKKPEHRKGKVQLINATDLYTSMRKNEGNKRKKVSDDQIREISEIYAACENSKISLVMDSREFGYRRIKVLRPLRMSLHITKEGLKKLQEEKVWAKLTDEQKTAWIEIITADFGKTHEYGWAESILATLSRTKPAIGKTPKPLAKAMINSFGEHDPKGNVVTKDGIMVPDDELSDYENVPLMMDVRDYFEQEVLPHAPDAFIDQSFCDEADKEIGVVGYEINFNRYFYEYQVPRELSAIDAELKAVEAEISEILNEVTE